MKQLKMLVSFLWITMVITSMPVFSMTLEDVQAAIENNNLEWTAGPTGVSRLSFEERAGLLTLTVPSDYVEPPEDSIDGLPFGGRAYFDWRDQNGVTGVRDQGNCGSCWAFATVAMVESAVKIYDGLDRDLSEQQLLSCNSYGYDCGGGWFLPEIFEYPGGVLESCMPYQAQVTTCTQSSCAKVAFIDGYQEINSSVTSIKNALQSGPVAAAMYVYDDLHYYTGGCYSHSHSSGVNHGILIIGYDDNACSGQGAW
ncbi:hypothetical protein JXA80_04265, partial [bacterium]|nr:hypothetical protein [candidate division CSSED10-310 bacterium]